MFATAAQPGRGWNLQTRVRGGRRRKNWHQLGKALKTATSHVTSVVISEQHCHFISSQLWRWSKGVIGWGC